MRTQRGETQSLGLDLQAGQKASMAIARDEARTVECRMAAPRGGDSEPTRGSATAVRPAIKTGEVVINGETETCKTRHEVTEREKVNGVTETCTRRVETREITREETEVMNEVTELTETQRETTKEMEVLPEIREIDRVENELNKTEETETKIQEETDRHEGTTEIKCIETREIEGELDGVKDEHTHMEVVEDNGGELAKCLVTRCEQLDSLLMERGEGVCPLKADRDQVGLVVPSELEGISEVNEELGGYRDPGGESPVRLCRCVWCRNVCTRLW